MIPFLSVVNLFYFFPFNGIQGYCFFFVCVYYLFEYQIMWWKLMADLLLLFLKNEKHFQLWKCIYLNIIFIKLSQKYKIHVDGTWTSEWKLVEKKPSSNMLKHQKQSKLFTILCLWNLAKQFFSFFFWLLLLCVIFFMVFGYVIACLILIHV